LESGWSVDSRLASARRFALCPPAATLRRLVAGSRLALGNAGDVKPVGAGVSEMRIDYGPGYRVYFQQRGPATALLLCAGDKSTQDADIRRAIQIAKDWKR